LERIELLFVGRHQSPLTRARLLDYVSQYTTFHDLFAPLLNNRLVTNHITNLATKGGPVFRNAHIANKAGLAS
jgi:hypothetical protein